MRFQMYIYGNNGFVELVVRDTSKQLHQSGAMLLRSQSIYKEDGGKLVWKNAAYPAAVWHSMQNNEGFKVLESESLAMIDANVDWKILNHIWDNRDGK